MEYYNGVPWTSYQIRKIARCACAGNAFPPPISKETTSLRSRHASRHVRDAGAMMHVEIAYPRWSVKRSRHSRSMRNLQFYVSGKRAMRNGIITSYAQCICTNYLKQLNARLWISSRIFRRFNYAYYVKKVWQISLVRSLNILHQVSGLEWINFGYAKKYFWSQFALC